jgi:hypothetical protein
VAQTSHTPVETIVGWALLGVLASTSVYFLLRETVAIAPWRTGTGGVVEHFSKIKNVADVLRYLLCLGCVMMELRIFNGASASPDTKRIVQAITALFLTVQTLDCLLAFEATVIATTMITEIVRENAAFAGAFFVINFGFMLGFSALLRDKEPGYENGFDTFMTTFNYAMSFDLYTTDAWTMCYSMLFALIVVVVLLNMVIALM